MHFVASASVVEELQADIIRIYCNGFTHATFILKTKMKMSVNVAQQVESKIN